jgi:hypothetical protein
MEGQLKRGPDDRIGRKINTGLEVLSTASYQVRKRPALSTIPPQSMDELENTEPGVIPDNAPMRAATTVRWLGMIFIKVGRQCIFPMVCAVNKKQKGWNSEPSEGLSEERGLPC